MFSKSSSPHGSATYGANETPNFVAVGGYDGMAGHRVRDQGAERQARPGPDHGAAQEFQGPEQPAGTDLGRPATRDIVQNEYLREVRRVGGKLANVEIETVGTAVKDPWKELNKK